MHLLRFEKWHALNEDWLAENGFKSSERDDGHGVRKGATTLCANIVDGPPIIAAFLRAMWALGEIQQTYLSMESGSDLFLGRCVAGLPTDSPKFGVLPPHWKNMDDPDIMRVIEKYYPKSVTTNPNISKRGLKLGLASLVFHAPWIRKHFHRNHVIFNHPLFATAGLVEALRTKLHMDDTTWTTELLSESSGILHKLDQRQNPVMEIRVAGHSGHDVDACGSETPSSDVDNEQQRSEMNNLGAASDGTDGRQRNTGAVVTVEDEDEDESEIEEEEEEQEDDDELEIEDEDERTGNEQGQQNKPEEIREFPVPEADLTGLCLYSPCLRATGVSGHIRSLIEQRLTTAVVSDLYNEHQAMQADLNRLDNKVTSLHTNLVNKIASLHQGLHQRQEESTDKILQGLQLQSELLRKVVENTNTSTMDDTDTSSIGANIGNGSTGPNTSTDTGTCTTGANTSNDNTGPVTSTNRDTSGTGVSMGTGTSSTSNSMRTGTGNANTCTCTSTIIDCEASTRMEATMKHLTEMMEQVITRLGLEAEAAPTRPVRVRREEEGSILPLRAEEIDSSHLGIPDAFRMSHVASAKEAWLLWWCPAPNQGRCAIRNATAKDLETTRCKKTLSEWRSFFEFMTCKLWEINPSCLLFTGDVHLLANITVAESAWLPIHSLMVDMGIDASKTPATLNRKLRKQEGFLRKSERTKKMAFIERKVWSRNRSQGNGPDSDSDSDTFSSS